MTSIKAVAGGDIKANRGLKISVREGGTPVLVYADNGYPHFRSFKDLEDGEEITIKITGNHVWKIEAGEELHAGEAVYVGEEGKLFARRRGEDSPAQLCGYVSSDAKEGEVVDLVRNMQMNGNWIVKVNEAVSTEGGEVDDEV